MIMEQVAIGLHQDASVLVSKPDPVSVSLLGTSKATEGKTQMTINEIRTRFRRPWDSGAA
jgi:hypothetical protein